MKAIYSEFYKFFSLPSAWLAFLISIMVSPTVAIINSYSVLSDLKRSSSFNVSSSIGFQELGFGVAGVIILGVIIISSEYFTESEESGNSRQITTSLMSVPSRLKLLLSKCVVVTISSAICAIIAIFITFVAIKLILGPYAPVIGVKEVTRFIGVIYYWILTGLLAFSITVFTRHGVIPLTLLIMNTSVVTFTYLLTKITSLANYLPDMAGLRMFTEITGSKMNFSPLFAGTIMTIWVFSILFIAAIIFCRRDV